MAAMSAMRAYLDDRLAVDQHDQQVLRLDIAVDEAVAQELTHDAQRLVRHVHDKQQPALKLL